MRTFFAIVFASLLASSSALASQVIYTDEQRKGEGSSAIFMDRAGDLYPPAEIGLDTFHMLNVRNGDRPYVHPSADEFAILRSLYEWKSSQSEDRDWTSLLAYAGVTKSGDFSRDWIAVQAKLRKDAAEKINVLGRQGDVVLLIHGFNNNYEAASRWYVHAEAEMRSAAAEHGRPVSFARLYWDGLDGRTPFFIWSKAQYNGFLVGVELRRILADVEGDTPIRVFTHSSGAYVIANALGDGSAAAELGKLPSYYPLRAAGGEGYLPPVHLKDLRLAMLVPAQPTHAFKNYFYDPIAGTAAPDKRAAIPSRLILGLSKRDIATNKGGLLSCNWKGATCMAVSIHESCHQVSTDLGITPPQLQAVNFAKQGWFHGHGVRYYTDDEEWSDLMRALFADDPGAPLGTQQLCPKARSS